MDVRREELLLGSGSCGGLGVEVRARIRVPAEGRAYGFAPGVGAKGVDVLVLGELDGIEHGLAQISEGGGSFGFDLPLGSGGEKAAQGGGEIAGREITAGEERGDIAAHFLGGLGLRLLARMEVAEVQMTGKARSATVVAIGEGERTQGRAVHGALFGHGSLQKLIELNYGEVLT
jgi:hypothetical protein